MNKIFISGRLTKDGEVRTTDADIKVYNSSVAVNRRIKNTDGTYDADFFNITLWKPSDNLIKYLKKGQGVLIEGRVQNRKYEKDGENRTITEIIVENLELIGSKKEENTEPNVEVPQNTKTVYEDHNSDIEIEDDDLPF